MTNQELISYISIPIISALIGWFTNYIAVKMIFRPRKPVKILFWTLQGLLPKRQKELALSVGETVEEKLFSLEDITGNLSHEELSERFTPIVRNVIDELMKKKLGQIPLLGTFLQGDILKQVREMLVDEVVESFPRFIHEIGLSLEEHVKVKEVIRQRIEGFDLAVLEEIVYKISSQELRAIELLGGVLGFIIGLAQVGIIIATK